MNIHKILKLTVSTTVLLMGFALNAYSQTGPFLEVDNLNPVEGDFVTITLNTEESSIFVQLEGIDGNGLLSEMPYEWQYQIPFGESHVKFTANVVGINGIERSNTIQLNIETVAILETVKFGPAEPAFLTSGDDFQLSVIGRFNDLMLRNLDIGGNNIDFSERVLQDGRFVNGDSPVISIGDNGLIQALEPGVAEVLVDVEGRRSVKRINVAEAIAGDSDGDGLTDLLENTLGSNPYRSDSDEDGFDDLIELGSELSPSDIDENGVLDLIQPSIQTTERGIGLSSNQGNIQFALHVEVEKLADLSEPRAEYTDLGGLTLQVSDVDPALPLTIDVFVSDQSINALALVRDELPEALFPAASSLSITIVSDYDQSPIDTVVLATIVPIVLDPEDNSVILCSTINDRRYDSDIFEIKSDKRSIIDVSLIGGEESENGKLFYSLSKFSKRNYFKKFVKKDKAALPIDFSFKQSKKRFHKLYIVRPYNGFVGDYCIKATPRNHEARLRIRKKRYFFW